MLQDGTISVRKLSCRPRSTRSRRITSTSTATARLVFPFSLVIGSVNATMNRSSLVLLGAVALAACVDLGVPHGVPSLSIQPVLDSVFVGDRTLAHRVTYCDENGNIQPAGTVVWTSTDPTIATIDAQTGAVTGVRRGSVVIHASAHGTPGGAFIVVSDTLDITLQLDTVYLLPGDTLSVPVTVLKQTPVPAAAVWFTAPSNAQFSIDSASGRITATATPGGPSRSEEHTSELQSRLHLVCRLLLEKKNGCRCAQRACE